MMFCILTTRSIISATCISAHLESAKSKLTRDFGNTGEAKFARDKWTAAYKQLTVASSDAPTS